MKDIFKELNQALSEYRKIANAGIYVDEYKQKKYNEILKSTLNRILEISKSLMEKYDREFAETHAQARKEQILPKPTYVDLNLMLNIHRDKSVQEMQNFYMNAERYSDVNQLYFVEEVWLPSQKEIPDAINFRNKINQIKQKRLNPKTEKKIGELTRDNRKYFRLQEFLNNPNSDSLRWVYHASGEKISREINDLLDKINFREKL